MARRGESSVSPYLDESQLEIATVDYFRELGYEYIHGAHIAPDLPAPPACALSEDRGAARQAGGEADGSHRGC
jgi:hypothetical protein